MVCDETHLSPGIVTARNRIDIGSVTAVTLMTMNGRGYLKGGAALSFANERSSLDIRPGRRGQRDDAAGARLFVARLGDHSQG